MIRHSKMKNGRMMKMKKRMSKIGCISTFPQMVVNRNNWCCLVQASMTSTTDTFGYIRKYIPVDRSSFLVWELTNTPSQTVMIAWHLAESNMYLFDINNKYLFIIICTFHAFRVQSILVYLLLVFNRRIHFSEDMQLFYTLWIVYIPTSVKLEYNPLHVVLSCDSRIGVFDLDR